MLIRVLMQAPERCCRAGGQGRAGLAAGLGAGQAGQGLAENRPPSPGVFFWQKNLDPWYAPAFDLGPPEL